MARLENNRRLPYVALLLFLFVITLSRYHLYVGFSLKIYMIFLAVFVCLYFRDLYFRPLYDYEIALLVFYFVYCLSGAFSDYALSSMRVIFGVAIVLGAYFLMKFMFEQITISRLEKAIATVGILFNSLSLGLYLLGFVLTDVSAVEVTSFGLLVDRDYPRLIGLLDDPNIYIFFNTVFFCFYLTHLKGWKHYLGFLLSLTTSVLTFSRGGLAVLALVFILYIVFSGSLAKKLKGLSISFAFVALIYVASLFSRINVNQIIASRLNDFSDDQGSGRFDLWEAALDYFLAHPLLGIGAFNFSDHYAFHHHETLYVHNTYLEILAEAGLIGFVFFGVFLILLFYRIYLVKLHIRAPYLVLTLFGFLLQMVSLSLVINEMFFLVLAILVKYLHFYAKEEEANDKRLIVDG